MISLLTISTALYRNVCLCLSPNGSAVLEASMKGLQYCKSIRWWNGFPLYVLWQATVTITLIVSLSTSVLFRLLCDNVPVLASRSNASNPLNARIVYSGVTSLGEDAMLEKKKSHSKGTSSAVGSTFPWERLFLQSMRVTLRLRVLGALRPTPWRKYTRVQHKLKLSNPFFCRFRVPFFFVSCYCFSDYFWLRRAQYRTPAVVGRNRAVRNGGWHLHETNKFGSH